MAFEVQIPPLGESITEGTISRWAKKDGEAVKSDEVLLELETDKAGMEIAADRAAGERRRLLGGLWPGGDRGSRLRRG